MGLFPSEIKIALDLNGVVICWMLPDIFDKELRLGHYFDQLAPFEMNTLHLHFSR